MKIIIAYPPINNKKGFPTIGQNRQFQFFNEPTYIYPIVPACAATLLKKSGHEVIWLDCIAENIDYSKFLDIAKTQGPGLIAIEARTPVMKEWWRVINDLKRNSDTPGMPKIALFGDHVTSLPNESFENSEVDFVLTGGDYDFLLNNLCNNLTLEDNTIITGALEPGIFYRSGEYIKDSGAFLQEHDLNSLPFIDRELTKWQLYAYRNGNFKSTPGTYIMSGRDCWWGKCSFCSWPLLYPKFRVRSVENVLDEIGTLIEKYAVKEIMDDTGSFPVGAWLKDFCNGVIARGYHKKINIDCNMRFGALSEEDFLLMKKANFRLLLFGLESANQETLNRLNKNLRVESIIQDCKIARKSGLYPHITIMFGYPWETYEDALKTLKLGSWLLGKGYAYTMQATIVIPYPGTPLFEECKDKGWLKSFDWQDYDMEQPVIKTQIPDSKIMHLVRGMYGVSFNPEFIMRKVLSMKSIDDLNYVLRAAKKVIGHILDFRHSEAYSHK